jgi:hypothetical protein
MGWTSWIKCGSYSTLYTCHVKRTTTGVACPYKSESLYNRLLEVYKVTVVMAFMAIATLWIPKLVPVPPCRRSAPRGNEPITSARGWFGELVSKIPNQGASDGQVTKLRALSG